MPFQVQSSPHGYAFREAKQVPDQLWVDEGEPKKTKKQAEALAKKVRQQKRYLGGVACCNAVARVVRVEAAKDDD